MFSINNKSMGSFVRQLKSFHFYAQLLSYIFHPLFIPMYGVLIYFLVTPRYFLQQNIRFLSYYLSMVAVLIPLLFLIVLMYAKTIETVSMKTVRERLFFSVIMATVYFIVFKKLTQYHQYIELYPFFAGIFLSVIMLLIYHSFGQKPSMHTTAMGGLLTFLVMWSYYSRVNIVIYLSIIIVLTSWVTAARFYLKAHTTNEIIRGFLIGGLGQVIGFLFVLRFY